MFSNVERSHSETMLPAPTPDGAERLSSWRTTKTKRSQRGRSRRTRTLIGAVVTTCTLTGLLTWATTTVRRAPRVSVSLASTDYRDNLNLPTNGYGDRAIGRFAAWATAENQTSQRHVELFKSPIELASAEDIANIQVDADANVALLYVSAHGISTATGPALLSDSAQSIADAIPVRDLIAKLADLPHRQNKVLMLDAANFVAVASLGIIHNNFARQMRELDDEIVAVPNLVVMISADNDQQSWIDVTGGTTVWAAAMLNAFNGLAVDRRNDGWIDIEDVHLSAYDSTVSLTRKLGGVEQTPLLLPLGDVGIERSRDIAIVPQDFPPVEIPSLSFAVRSALLVHWWQQHEELVTRSLHPAATKPIVWRRFERNLLRLEQFELAGCRDAADSCIRELESLILLLNQPFLVDSIACRTGVLRPELVGFDPRAELNEYADEVSKQLLDLSLDEASHHWLTIVEDQPNAETVAFVRRKIIEGQTQRLIDSLRGDKSLDRARLDKVSKVVECISDPMQPLPQPGLLVQLANRDFPQDASTAEDAQRLAKWLELSLHADALFGDGTWWTPQIVPWAKNAMQEADQQRRLAGDLLFGDAATRARADEHLANAEQAYRNVSRISSVIIHAKNACSIGQNQLCRIREIIFARSIDFEFAAMMTEISDVELLFRMLDEIELRLDSGATVETNQPSSELAKIENYVTQFNEKLQNLSNLVNAWQVNVLASETARLPESIAALTAFGGSSQARIASWNRMAYFTDSESNGPSSVSPAESLSRAKDAVTIRGRLALAGWTSSRFDQFAIEGNETKSQVLHRLELFTAENQWWQSSAKIGEEIAIRESRVINSFKSLNPGEKADIRSLLRAGTIAPVEARHQLLNDRRQTIAGYLPFEADRFFRDGYASFEEASPPYYQRVHELLTYDAVSLRTRASNSLSPSNQATTDEPAEHSHALRIDCPDEVIWTTQQTDQLSIDLRTFDKSHEGYAIVWAQTEGGLNLAQPVQNQRICRHIQPETAENLAKNAKPDRSVIVTLDRVKSDNKTSSTLDVYGYFRGHRLHESVKITTADEPEIRYVQNPHRLGARIAVRSPKVQGSGNGTAVTLVLDCSGSMGAKRGESFGPNAKYAQAVNAVETLLSELPSGTQLSIWCFGQATDASKTVQPAERSIRQIQAPFAWDSGDLGLKKQVIDSISYPTLEPWNESPLLATMIAAASDLRNHHGLKSMVVITDGFDNRIAHDAAMNPLSLAPEALIKKQFGGTGITVNVIAFQVEPGDELNTRRQLATVESLLPPGRFVEVEQTAELANALRGMLKVTPFVSIKPANSNDSAPNEIKLALSALSDAPPTWSPTLQSGLYHITTDKAAVPTLVDLKDGDQLVLAPSTHNHLGLWPIMGNELRWCPQKQVNRWSVALEPCAGANEDSLQCKLVLWSESPPGAVSIQRPGDVWIEASQNNLPLPLSWHASHDQPRSSFDIVVRCPSTVAPEFKIWLSERKALPTGTITRDRDFKYLADIAPATWLIDDHQIRLQSAAIEMHEVAGATGAVKSQPCLVLRASMPVGSHYRLRTEGIQAEGFDEQCFTQLGQYTLRQWPLTREAVERSLRAIHLISIEQFKRDTERVGGTTTFDAFSQPIHRAGSVPSDSLTIRSRP